MVYLRLGLYAEGPTDYGLLIPLLRRLTEDICRVEARSVVDVEDVQPLDSPARFSKRDRATRIVEAARTFWGGACILFVHADGAGDPDRARAEQIEPAAQLVRSSLTRGVCVAVVPVREIEAWTLVDGDALRAAFGTTLGDAELRVVRSPADAERLLDPKHDWRVAFAAAVGAHGRRRSNASDFFARVGERIDLVRLRGLPAFVRLEEDLRGALRDVGVLPSSRG